MTLRSRISRSARAAVASPNGVGWRSRWSIGAAVAVSVATLTSGYVVTAEPGSRADDYERLVQTFDGVYASDSFTGPAGSSPSSRLWTPRLGGGGWGNKELQKYTDDPANLALDGHGNLRITAMRTGRKYTSARIDTLGKLAVDSGLVAVRAKLPHRRGTLPAIWMLGADVEQVGYPESGEIDIVERTGQDTTYGLLGPHTDPRIRAPWKVQDAFATPLDEDFHTYWIHRRAGRVEFGVDGHSVAVITPSDLPKDAMWVMDAPFFLVLNVAIGGRWPGDPGPGSLPATMLVDWVRVYL
ncbi:MAG: glycoside hydrolase family 16 protein [Gordonia sp. (in: high G+C Gram-positive bacteria)]